MKKEKKEIKQEITDEVIKTEVPDKTDGIIEEDDNFEAEETLEEKIERALRDHRDQFLRLAAEYDNFRKRTIREKADLKSFAVIDCVSEILPVLDNFERAADAETTDSNYKSGIDMILTQLKTALEKIGVEEIPALGEDFNPNFHDAVRQAETEEYDENTVCEVYQKGYKFGDKIIRAAMVAVTS